MQINIDLLKKYIPECQSWRSLFVKMVLPYGDSSINKAKLLCLENNISYAHFKGQAIHRGKKFEKVNIQDYLTNKRQVTTHKLRCLLIEKGLKEHKCEKCNNTQWLGELIPLELHHIDGNNKNNLIENLQLLCPNCHALTPNFRALNKKEGKNKSVTDEEIIEAVKTSYTRREALMKLGLAGYGGNYPRINRIINEKSLSFLKTDKQLDLEMKIKSERKEYENGDKFYVYKDENTLADPNWRTNPKLEQRKVERPPKEVLEKLIYEKSLSAIGKQFGVCDNSIRKWCEWYKIELPNFSKGYWRRRQVGMTHEQALNPPPKPQRPKSRQLTIDQVKEIKKRLANNESIKVLSEEYQFSYEAIKSIKYGYSHSHITID